MGFCGYCGRRSHEIRIWGGGGEESAVEFSVSGFCKMAACFNSRLTLKGLCA